MNIIETRAVLNIVKKIGKCAPKAKREDLEIIIIFLISAKIKHNAMNCLNIF